MIYLGGPFGFGDRKTHAEKNIVAAPKPQVGLFATNPRRQKIVCKSSIGCLAGCGFFASIPTAMRPQKVTFTSSCRQVIENVYYKTLKHAFGLSTND